LISKKVSYHLISGADLEGQLGLFKVGDPSRTCLRERLELCGRHLMILVEHGLVDDTLETRAFLKIDDVPDI
jgi:hypothetical protein